MGLADVMSHAGLALYAEIAMVLFILVFIAVVIRLFASKRSDLERHARMPLEDDAPAAKEPRHE